MKKLTLALAGLIGLSQAVQGGYGKGKGRIDYDYTCEA